MEYSGEGRRRVIMAQKDRQYRYRRARGGMTLVEILVSVLVLGVLAIGGAALIQRSRTDLLIQKYKRAAIEAANARMEVLTRQLDFDVLSGMTGTSVVQTVTLNGQPGFVMTTTVTNAGVAADNCLGVKVSVTYRPAGGDVVALQTFRSK
jgi:prepilin-type N-terminal cleavage/methylation domain-containing protein